MNQSFVTPRTISRLEKQMRKTFKWFAVLSGTLVLSALVSPVSANPANRTSNATTINFAAAAAGVPEFVEYDVPTPRSIPGGIVVGPDGYLWFIESIGNNLGRISTDGQITEFPIPTPSANLPRQAFVGIGPDGMVWFTESAANKLGRITPVGQFPDG